MFTEQEFTDLVKQHIDTVFRIALNGTQNPTEAEDIVQEVFLALWNEKKPFCDEAHLRFWLMRVTVNKCRKWHRHPWRRHVSYEEYISTMTHSTQERREVLSAVMALPHKYRLPIYLYYFEQYSTQEIAKILKIPKGTVCTYLNRGRQMLKIELQEVESDG